LSENGKQRYHCKSCGLRSRQDWKGNAYSEEFKAQVLAAYNERMSLRGIERVFGVSRETVALWVKKRCPDAPGEPALAGGDSGPGPGR
jgi:transposase-like protein